MKRAIAVLFCLFLLIILGSYENARSEEQNQAIKDALVPFRHISGIKPGETMLSIVVKLFGEPESVEITEKWEVAGIEGGGDKVIKYNSRGLSLLISKENMEQPDPMIDAVWAETPYRGRSPNGLYIGMSRTEALAICRRDYLQTKDLRESFYFAEKQGGEDDFQVWFKDERLIRIKIFGRL